VSARLLIADDAPDVVEALRLLLKGEGYRIDGVASPAAALTAAQDGEYDLALIDLNYTRDTTSGQEGLELLSKLMALDAPIPVVVMTAWGSVELAVEAMRRGARDFVQKPWENERLLAIVRNQLDLARALRRGEKLEAENRLLRADGPPDLLSASPAMRPVLDLIERVGPSDANVLITGENGTGKGVVARRLHAASPRAPRPFVSVNMGGLSETLFESEFFGHVKGAFTDAKVDRLGRFEMADQGTLFLDEIANLSMTLQSKLLRVVETGEFERTGSSRTRRSDVRLVSATNADLHAEVAAGRFRQDLLFRLNTIEIPIPPLRERRADIPVLADHFLADQARRYRKSIAGFDDGARRALAAHAWPGNVRELAHVVERAVLMARGSTVAAEDLGLVARGAAAPGMDEMSLEDVEKLLIQKALARYDGNVTEAAKLLGLSRSALYRRLQKLGMSRGDDPGDAE